MPSELDAFEAVSNVDAEQAVLGILLDPLARNDFWREKCQEIRRNVSADDFFRVQHRTIFEAILAAMDESGTEPDFLAIVNRLPSDVRAYAGSLPGIMPGCALAGYYATLVRESANRRRLLAALGEAAMAAYDVNRPVQDALAEAHLLLDQATTSLSRDAGIFDVSDIAEGVYDLYDEGLTHGLETGWSELDLLYRVSPGQWTLVTGIPSHGKSAFIDALMVNLARREKWRFAVCSPENQPLAMHARKLARIWAGKPFDLNDVEPRMTREELMAALAWQHEHFTFVPPHEKDSTMRGVLHLVEGVLQRGEIHGVVIDPWNELDHSRPSGQTETEYISESLSLLRRFARRYQVHIWLVAHPAKLERPKDGGAYPVPRPYDVSGSAHWFNKADNAIAVYRDDEDRWVQVHVQKVRFDTNGKRGVAHFRYSPRTGQFTGIAA